MLASAVLAAIKHDRICGRCMMLEVNYACSGLILTDAGSKKGTMGIKVGLRLDWIREQVSSYIKILMSMENNRPPPSSTAIKGRVMVRLRPM